MLLSHSTITELPSGHQQLVWSIDASVPLFGVKFNILFITCLVLFLILIPFNLILLFIRFLLKFKIVTGPAKTGHVGTNYTPSFYRSYLSIGNVFFHSVACIMILIKYLLRAENCYPIA